MSLKDKITSIVAICIFAFLGFIACEFLVMGAQTNVDGETIFAFFGLLFCCWRIYAIAKELVKAAKATSWKIVKPNSPIVNFESEAVHRTRNKSYYISTVTYADGFKYVSTKTKYSNFKQAGLTHQSYQMSVDKDAICQEAQKAHNAAVRKKYRKTGGKM